MNTNTETSLYNYLSDLIIEQPNTTYEFVARYAISKVNGTNSLTDILADFINHIDFLDFLGTPYFQQLCATNNLIVDSNREIEKLDRIAKNILDIHRGQI